MIKPTTVDDIILNYVVHHEDGYINRFISRYCFEDKAIYRACVVRSMGLNFRYNLDHYYTIVVKKDAG